MQLSRIQGVRRAPRPGGRWPCRALEAGRSVVSEDGGSEGGGWRGSRTGPLGEVTDHDELINRLLQYGTELLVAARSSTRVNFFFPARPAPHPGARTGDNHEKETHVSIFLTTIFALVVWNDRVLFRWLSLVKGCGVALKEA